MKNQLLDYDIKTGKHGTALEEWPPHKVLSPKFFEWYYWTCVMEGTNGHRYFLFWCDFNFSSEEWLKAVKAFDPTFELPEGKQVLNAQTQLSDYNSGFHMSDVDLTVASPEESFDFRTNTRTYRSPRYQSDWSYDGKNVELKVTGPKYRLELSATGGEHVMWAKDKLGIEGLIQEGAPEERSFYYSLTNLPFQGRLSYEEADGSWVTTEVVGRGWIDRQWGDFMTASWEWTSFRLADGDRINMYNFFNGHQVGTYQKLDGSCEYFDAFKVIQNGYAKTPNDVWFSWGWSYEIPVKGKKYTVEPLSKKDVMVAPGNQYFEGLGRLLDEQGNQVGWSVNESMDVRLMKNAPYDKFQNN